MTDVIHSEECHGLMIEVFHDHSATSPHEFDEGLAPMLVCTGLGQAESLGFGDEATEAIYYLTNEAAMLNWRELVKLMNPDADRESYFIEEVLHLSGLDDAAFPFPEHFRDALVDLFHGGNYGKPTGRGDLESLRDIYRIAGVPCHVFERAGYSQGDWLAILVVHTPGFRSLTGSPEYDPKSDDPALNGREDMSRDADTIAAYRFGDCYAYRVVDPDDRTADLGPDASCFGFLGAQDSDEWKYMMGEARSAAETIATERAAKIAA